MWNAWKIPESTRSNRASARRGLRGERLDLFSDHSCRDRRVHTSVCVGGNGAAALGRRRLPLRGAPLHARGGRVATRPAPCGGRPHLDNQPIVLMNGGRHSKFPWCSFGHPTITGVNCLDLRIRSLRVMLFVNSNSHRSVLRRPPRVGFGNPTALLLASVLLACSGCNNSQAPAVPAPAAGATAAGATAPPRNRPMFCRKSCGSTRPAMSTPPLNNSCPKPGELGGLDEARGHPHVGGRVRHRGSWRTGSPSAAVHRSRPGAQRLCENHPRSCGEARKRGDDETAKRYVAALNRFGEQLRDANTVTVFKQTGKALASMRLSE